MKPIVFCLLLIFATCNAQKNNIGTSDGREGQNSDYGLTLIASDFYGGTEVAETLVIKDVKSLQKFYARVNRTRKPGLPVPDIDFSLDMVVVHCSGATDKDAIPSLYVMEETDEQMVLGIRATDKESNSSAITTPFSVYRMPLTKMEVIVRQ